MSLTATRSPAYIITWPLLVGCSVKFHWSRPLLPAFCHIIELIARSPST